ncbi:CHAT domain-containing protein [Bradyrhizobium sp. Ce-3]|uniref:CHAT domain-containing protein n=1 Tax=Bradyrhizobium sp. Ce-3 TaxID=2913970 RepID=UPI001FB890EB|nr:CHAT domain-containing protein [Bradyrhizobium sp. Ce-3]GKQ50071.1 hypothetical protein BRSPCE3_09260 [Bradyrhizobium sp. Ce-3]
MTLIPTIERLRFLLRSDAVEARDELLATLTSSRFFDQIRVTAKSTNPSRVIAAIQTTIYEYCAGRSPEYGAALAAATHEYALELWETGNRELVLSTLSGLADSHCTALELLGRSDEVLRATARYIDLYTQLNDRDNLPSLKVRRANALLNLKRVDEAELILRDASLNEHMGARRLREQIAAIKVDVVTVRGTSNNVPQVGDPKGLVETIDKVLPRIASAELSSDIVVRHRIQKASTIFIGRPSKEEIRKSLEILTSCLSWARENKQAGLENEALWGLYLCHSRLDHISEAADVLINLRMNLESMRDGIKDPRKRGGVFAAHPHLFGATCEYLERANRPADLLVAIEASKGRAIADRLTQKAGTVVSDATTYSCVTSLPKLTSRDNFHYLTYFVDDTRVYAILVTRQGNICMPKPIEISSEALRDTQEIVDPRRWNKPQVNGGISANLQAMFSPLVAWLGELLETSVLRKGDHICYSPDDQLHNIPLHYLRFQQRMLIDTFSLSRVHSAFHLDLVLSKPKAPPPDTYVAIAVPLDDEQQDAQFMESIEAPLRWLNLNCRKGNALQGTQATPQSVNRESLQHRLVHFSTHGYFPQDGANPFANSGLYLSDEAGLPGRLRAEAGPYDGKLTPESIVATGVDLSGSHVSVMACVSGLAKKGIAGDALGLDWAFIQAGASSLISTHWNVSAAAAAAYFTMFYDKWIRQKQPRAVAHRAAMLELLGDDRAANSLNKWTAFSLTGDFR